MDANSSNGKKKKMVDEESMLGGLPGELLQDIISNLPIKEAIETSLISGGWRDLWKGISKVELIEGDEDDDKRQFTNFVESFLAVFDPSRLRKFSLICEVSKDSTAQVNRWLTGFINPTIEDLTLDFERVEEEPLIFPDKLFTSKNLTHFHLSMPNVINLPCSIDFSSLRNLTLKYVIFPNTASTQKLFTASPSLEELTLIDCNWMNVGSVCIVCPSLLKLVIREWKDDDEDENPKPYCCILIIATNLKAFSYDGDMLNDYFLCSTTSVTDGTVQVQPPPPFTLHAGYFVIKLLIALSNVKKLSISDYAAEALRGASYLIQCIPLFGNLLELHVDVVSETTMNFACDALLTILRHSPNLEAVYFDMGVSLDENAVNNVNPLPTCFETNLKNIVIYGFTGSEEEMIAIKFMLQSTPVLEGLRVYYHAHEFNSDAGSERLDELFKQIGEFPTASADCGIYFG